MLERTHNTQADLFQHIADIEQAGNKVVYMYGLTVGYYILNADDLEG
jgi:hypothetical protein